MLLRIWAPNLSWLVRAHETYTGSTTAAADKLKTLFYLFITKSNMKDENNDNDAYYIWSIVTSLHKVNNKPETTTISASFLDEGNNCEW